MDIKNFSVEKDLVVGHRAIDMQHTEFFNRLNTLIGAAVDKKSVREMQTFIRFLSDYIQKHLSMEERLMTKYGYPDIEEHKAQHDFFRKQYTTVMDEFSNGKLDMNEFIQAMQQQVGEWFENHIRKVDRTMAEFLIEKGGAQEGDE